MKTYNALFQRYKDQPNNELFGQYYINYEQGENWDTIYSKLANIAKKENWNFTKPEFKKRGQSFPILSNYLNYTFNRVQELGLTKTSDDGSKCCFNTGLQTKDDKDIYALFRKSKKEGDPDWSFYDFADSYSHKLTELRPLPPIATYISDASDLIFDTKLKLDVNFEHIVDHNSERLPAEMQSNRRIAVTSIRGAVESLRDKVIRNYKTAIPHWHGGKVQLLLPLNLTHDNIADLAMVVDKDKEGNIYRARTVLSMDMAYIDARLITRPDRDWLNP